MKIYNLKIDVSCEASVNFQHIAQNATPATEFAPCRHLTQPCQCDLQKPRSTTRLKCCACHEKWRWTRRKCCACHEICHASSQNVAKVAPATQNDFRHVTERCWMSRSATPATRNEATRRLKPPKMIPPAELPIGTAIRSSHERLRTVANGCDRERNVERTHPQPPDPQSETGTLATHSGKCISTPLGGGIPLLKASLPCFSRTSFASWICLKHPFNQRLGWRYTQELSIMVNG